MFCRIVVLFPTMACPAIITFAGDSMLRQLFLRLLNYLRGFPEGVEHHGQAWGCRRFRPPPGAAAQL